jgi:hypothetical protein
VVTVTVYVVVATGATVIAAVGAPVFHRYAVPPEAVNVELAPLQVVSVAGVILAVTVVTVTVAAAVAEQPAALVTVTVYDVVAVGDTVIAAVVALVLQV